MSLLAMSIAVLSEYASAADVHYRAVAYIPYFHPQGGPFTDGYDINDRGEVCGVWTGTAPFAFIWAPDVPLHDLGILGGCPSLDAIPSSLNELGHAVGRDGGAGCTEEAWIWTPESGMVGLGSLPGLQFRSVAFAINDLDQVVGQSGLPLSESQPFLWSPANGMISLYDLPGGHMREVFDINNSSVVVGWAELASGERGAARWAADSGIELLRGSDGSALEPASAISDMGQVTGPGFEGYLWDPVAGTRPLGRLTYNGVLSDRCVPFAINDRGQVVGRCYFPESNAELSFIWDAQNGIRSLQDLINPCNRSRYRGMFPKGINNHGLLLIEGDPVAVFEPYLPGDLDEDGDIDLADLGTLLMNFGRTDNVAYADGDVARCDHRVDLRDLAELLSNFGETLP